VFVSPPKKYSRKFVSISAIRGKKKGETMPEIIFKELSYAIVGAAYANARRWRGSSPNIRPGLPFDRLRAGLEAVYQAAPSPSSGQA